MKKLYESIFCLFIGIYFVNCNVVNDSIFETDRWRLEFAHFKIGLKMENNVGELVELTLGNLPSRTARTFASKNVDFLLYTRQNPTISDPLITHDDKSVTASNFKSDKPTYFITHGWVNNENMPSCAFIRNEYLKKCDCNVIVVDWSRIAFSAYLWASYRVSNVGKEVAAMMEFLQTVGLKFELTTLVGHSLGAHVMGIAGYRTGGRVHSVIGLDPALPLFFDPRPDQGISVLSAKHVQIIHTDAGFLGASKALGHTDFFVNGGKSQPGCGLDLSHACSHSRAIYIFGESINSPCAFRALKCNGREQLDRGECHGSRVTCLGDTNTESRGIFYLKTTSEIPFTK